MDQSASKLALQEAQLDALGRLFLRDQDSDSGPTWGTWAEMLSMVHPGYGCVMIPWAGMLLGIEPDGYTHS